MNEKQNNNLEKAFQDSFSNFESTPSQEIWKNIDAELLDQKFKSNLESLEAPTSEKVWNNVISVVEIDSLFNQSFQDMNVTPAQKNWELISSTINFDQHFENSFQQYKEVPNPEIWDSIANNEFETHCRSKLNKFEVRPSEDNWEIIKRAIPAAIIPIRALIPHLSRVAAILLVAISIPFLVNKSGLLNKSSNLPIAFNVPTTNVDIDKTDLENTTISNVVSKVTPTTAVKQLNSNDSKNSVTDGSSSIVRSSFVNSFSSNSDRVVSTSNQLPATLVNNELPKQVISSDTRKTKTIDKLINSYDGEIVNDNNLAFNNLKTKNLDFSSNTINARTESFVSSLKGPGNSSEFEEIKLSNKLFSITDNPRAVKMLNYSGLYVYISSQFSNTWVVNRQVQEDLNEYNTAKYMIDFGGSAGVGFGFQFSPRVAIEAGWRRATLNQKFRELVPNQLYVNNELKTSYSTIQMLGKYTLNRIKSNRRNPITSSAIFGLHNRNLKRTSLNSDVDFDQSVFINKEVGVTGGFDIDFHLSELISLNLGARGSIGTDVRDLSTISSNSRFNNEYGIRAAVQYKISQ